MKKRGVEGVELKLMRRIILLAYADDLVFLSLSIEEMKSILELLRLYCEENGLVGNTGKTNIVIFRKGGRKFSNLSFFGGRGNQNREILHLSRSNF